MTEREQTKASGELIQCTICGDYIKVGEVFQCPRCRRTGMCRKHRVPGTRECSACVYEKKSHELGQIKQQIAGIKSFLRLTQFVIVVFVILFAAGRSGIPEVVEFLQFGVVTDNLPYLGGAAVIAYLIFFFILQSQKQQIRTLEEELVRKDLRKGIQ